MFKVTRTYPAPASLALRKSYSDEDVLSTLEEIFYGKCYLCESKYIINLNVEHLKPHKEKNDDLKYDWNNLFYVCSRCNNFKRAIYDNILDCTSTEIDVLLGIKHAPPASPYGKLKITAQLNCERTILTADLLQKIFNSDSTANKKIAGKELRKRVFLALNHFNNLFIDYLDEKLLAEKN